MTNVSSPENLVYEKIIYNNDKISYNVDDVINLDIINNSNESIYLAPCEYFNKFEKKISGKWQSVSLVDCNAEQITADPTSIEKITKKVEEAVLAKRLGEGLWRGVSVVYFGCQKAQSESCKNNIKIFTNEFTIGGAKELKISASNGRTTFTSQDTLAKNDPEVASYSAPQY
jgi:hypothetical protein